ncbi:uncharacterized protein LOC117336209 isoform X2 [Pecten maximus]|uniref:uncharacterized protein LOC117336209 isoform X2 n=1 Tax=Pecten maximus TaxID=6579 RepID=UPI0014583D20|nr:uncharacterized protein LOC117336209 isoform X2 [Pecten maximus]
MLLRNPTSSVVVRLLLSGNKCFNRVQNHLLVRGLVSSLDNEQYYTLPVSFQTRTPGERMTVDVGIWDVRPFNMTPHTPLVVAVHGEPGSSRDFEVIGRKLAGHNIRVVGLNFPGNGKSRLLRQDIYRLDYSTEGKYHMLTTILDALAITRSLRPFVAIKMLAAILRNSYLHSAVYKCLPFIYKISGFMLDEEAFASLPIAVESVRYADFNKMQAYAETAACKKHPFIMAITRNDKIGEWHFAMEMAHHMGIEEGEITEYRGDSVTIGDSVGKYDNSCYRRVLLFERGGHLVHKAHETEIIKQILLLLKVVCNHDS